MKKADAKSILVQIRMQPSERAECEARAKAAGMKLSAWIRATLLKG